MSKNRLAIIPDQTHYDIFFSPKLVTTALPFLDGVSGSNGWAPEARGRPRPSISRSLRQNPQPTPRLLDLPARTQISRFRGLA